MVLSPTLSEPSEDSINLFFIFSFCLFNWFLSFTNNVCLKLSISISSMSKSLISYNMSVFFFA